MSETDCAAIRQRTAQQFREARKTAEGRIVARFVWQALRELRRRLVDRVGLEPTTSRLRVDRSTN